MSDFPAAIDLASLDGSDSFRLDGIDADNRIGFSVLSAGDVNGDGFDDVIIGALAADNIAGESYVVFGRGSQSESTRFRTNGAQTNPNLSRLTLGE